MFSLFKKKNNNPEIPNWASAFDEKEYSTFRSELDSYFDKLNVDYKIGDGVIEISENIFGFGILGLTNVLQFCKQEKPSHYRHIISDHFDSMLRAHKFDDEFNKIVSDFEKIKQYIGVRLYDNEYVANIGQKLTIGQNFAGDIYSMVVFDLPDSVINIKPEQTDKWNKTNEELFTIGINNIKAKYPFSISQENFGEFDIWFIQGEHFFTANIVFEFENRKELIGSKGSLIGLPHRHSAIIYPIENLEVVKAINGIIPTIYGMNQEGPGSLSNKLFWYRDGIYTELPYKFEDGKLQFFPPDNFVELLNELKAK